MHPAGPPNPVSELAISPMRYSDFLTVGGFAAALFLPLVLSAQQGSPKDPDLVTMQNGAVHRGQVVETGGNSIRLESGGGSRTLLKKDVRGVQFNPLRQSEAKLDTDRLEFKSGRVVDGDAELIQGGRKVRVSIRIPSGKGTRTTTVVYPMTEVRRIRWKNESAFNSEGKYYTAELKKAIEGALASLQSGSADEIAPAKKLLSDAGIFAYYDVERALETMTSEGGERLESHSAKALLAIRQQYLLQQLLHDDVLERFPRSVEHLGYEADSHRRDELLKALVSSFPEESEGLVLYLLRDPLQAESTRALLVDLLRRLHRHQALLNLYNESDGPLKFASAIALARNRILLGVPTLIDALSLGDAAIREVASSTLRDVTGKDFRFRSDGAAAARAAAIERWGSWWKENQVELEKNAVLILRKGRRESPEWKQATELWKLAHDAWTRASSRSKAEKDAAVDEAIRLLREAADTDPTFVKAHISLAVLLYVEREEHAESERILMGLVERPVLSTTIEDSFWIQLELGNVLRVQSKIRLALESYEECLALQPDNITALLGKSDCLWLLSTGKESIDAKARRELSTRALEGYERAIQLVETSLASMRVLKAEDLPELETLPFPRRSHNRSVLDIRRGYERQVVETFGKVARVYTLRGEHESASDRLQKGLDYLSASIDRKEMKDVEARLRTFLGLSFERQGRRLEALRQYDHVLGNLDGNSAASIAGKRRLRKAAGGGAK